MGSSPCNAHLRGAHTPIYEPHCVLDEAVCESCPDEVAEYRADFSPENFNDEVRAVNDLLRISFPADRVIDFYSIVSSQLLGTDGDFVDPLHLSAAAQAKRAAAARDVLDSGTTTTTTMP